MARTPPSKLWNRDFTIVWLGNAQSDLGSALSTVALAYLVLDLTGSVAATGVVLALGMLPGLLAPFAGTLVDRVPLKAPLLLGDLCKGLLGLGVWYLAIRGELSPDVLYAVALLQGGINTFYNSAFRAWLPQLVPAGELARANGLMGVASQSTTVVGLVAGGFLVSLLGSATVILLDAASFLLMAGLLLLVSNPPRPARAGENTYFQDLREGLVTLWASPILRLIPLLGFFAMAAFAPLNSAMPKHMLDLGGGPEAFGVFVALVSTGMLLGSMAVTWLGARFDARRSVTLGYGLAAAGFTLLALAGSYAPALVAAAVIGLGVGLVTLANTYLLQTLVPHGHLGRAFGVLEATGQLGMPLTLLALAGFIDRVSLPWVFAGAAAVTAALTLAWAAVARGQGAQAGEPVFQAAEAGGSAAD